MRSDEDGAGDIIVSRTFERDDGNVVLLIHRPRPDPKFGVDADPADPPWRCRYDIRFPSAEAFRGSALGIDAMQALLLALGAAGVDLRYKNRGELRPALRWLGGDDLGLTIATFD